MKVQVAEIIKKPAAPVRLTSRRLLAEVERRLEEEEDEDQNLSPCRNLPGDDKGFPHCG